MIDMLVRLYDLPDASDIFRSVENHGITLRRARAFELYAAASFARMFSEKWASEVQVALAHQPAACFIATENKKIIGFACYDTTMRGFFGPTGVATEARGKGVGKALLYLALHALRDSGHAYAIIGGVGPREFYEKTCGAIEIPGSSPGIYRDILP